jgi:hypothetical protein
VDEWLYGIGIHTTMRKKCYCYPVKGSQSIQDGPNAFGTIRVMMIGTNCGSIWTRTMSEARRNYVKKISEEKFPEQYPGDKEVNGYINRSADFSR